MTQIKHEPLHKPMFDVERVIELYSEKDDVDIKYVCTTALDDSAQAYDIFYRTDGTPHPEFGNVYFGLTYVDGIPYIGNADRVEDLTFDTIHGVYSRHRHDFIPAGSVMLDGGRAYTRVVGDGSFEIVPYVVRDGDFIVAN